MEDKNTSKKVITFIFLKIIEIGGLFSVIFGPYMLGRFLNKYESTSLMQNNWMNGVSHIISFLLIVAFCGALLFLLYLLLKEFVMINWRWACILNETPKERKKRESMITKEMKEKDRKTKEKITEKYGYGLGDRVKIIKGVTNAEKLLIGKVRKVKSVGWWGVTVEGSECYFLKSEVKLSKKSRSKDDVISEAAGEW